MTDHSVSIAKERLKQLLVSDRIHCEPNLSEQMTYDLYYTVSKYIQVKPECFTADITRTDIHIKYMGENN